LTALDVTKVGVAAIITEDEDDDNFPSAGDAADVNCCFLFIVLLSNDF
jgi:hypothetical protein